MKKILLVTVFALFAALGSALAGTEVSRIAVATAITDHEPAGVNNIFKSDVGKIYCFTEISTDEAPTGILHVWQHEGKTMAEVPLQINAARWRTYSSKKIDSSWLGHWKVEVFSDKGESLGATEFVVLK